MTFIDFFAGVGGIRTGLEAAGHKCVGFVEIDKFAAAAYRSIHDTKGEFYASDVRAVEPMDLPEADLYTFGFPCQPFSIGSNRRLGFEDTRGTLVFEVLRLAKIRKPAYLFAENVSGLVNISGGTTLHTILCAMGELGYFVEFQCINSDAYIPQMQPVRVPRTHLHYWTLWRMSHPSGVSYCTSARKISSYFSGRAQHKRVIQKRQSSLFP